MDKKQKLVKISPTNSKLGWNTPFF